MIVWLWFIYSALNFEIRIAHCNFQLRGLDSFSDQNFVQDYAAACDVLFLYHTIWHKSFAEDYKLTILPLESCATTGFTELPKQRNTDYILTAHHADDNLETFLINLSRGTGLDGLTGIQNKNDKVFCIRFGFKPRRNRKLCYINAVQWRRQ
jgi:tRNA(Ile)-lysidine synthase